MKVKITETINGHEVHALDKKVADYIQFYQRNLDTGDVTLYGVNSNNGDVLFQINVGVYKRQKDSRPICSVGVRDVT